MKVVALISGGKDSCYNILQCVQAGHEIVALANLKPENKDELDSFMYQTVGHQGVELYSEAMNIPLYRHPTTGVALQSGKSYIPTPEDEVEDLYQLLTNVKEEVNIEAVSVGAVLSDYQRLRVENVCSRLGLVALAYLWRRDQAELLQEMIDYNIDAIIIKVAALGLDPTKHLGMRISEIQPHLVKMNEKYGLNICGEGGEYETFTLDCPLFSKSLVIDDYETVIHSNDAIAPVGYLNFRKLRLVDKEDVDSEMPLIERLRDFSLKSAEDYITDIDQSDLTDTELDSPDHQESGRSVHEEGDSKLLEMQESEPAPSRPSLVMNSCGWCWIGGIVGQNSDISLAAEEAVQKLQSLMNENDLEVSDLVCVSLYISDMSSYASVNSAYLKVITGPEPPVRVCLGTGLHGDSPVMLNAVAHRSHHHHRRITMHVQALSHWAPANIGPYSQLVKIGDIFYVAGQIGLVPSSLELVSGGVRRQCRLALRHIARLVKAVDKDIQLRDVVLGICYVTNAHSIGEVRKEWERRSNNAIVDYIVVPQLPKSALVEWQVWLHRGNTRFEYEETGCVVGENRVSLRRRWNYDNTVSVIVCYVSKVSSVSNPVISEEAGCGDSNAAETKKKELSESQLSEIFRYSTSRLFKGSTRSSEQAPSGGSRSTDCEDSSGSDADPHDAQPAVMSCSLQLFYVPRHSAVRPETVYAALDNLNEYRIASTLVPVAHLNHPNTLMSLVVVRHQ